jgi:acyl-CoA thioester hydrolase
MSTVPLDASAVLPPLTDRASFRIWHTDKLRYADLDRQNHVNNAVFSVFCEGGRVAFLEHQVRPHLMATDLTVLAKLNIDYLREMHYPGEVEVGTRLLRVGRSSLTFGQAVFKDGACTAMAVAIVVVIDAQTRRSKPFSDELAEQLRRN